MSYNLKELYDIYEEYKKEGRDHKDGHIECASDCRAFARTVGKVLALTTLIRNKNGGSLVL